jgi:lambda family phage portal protein
MNWRNLIPRFGRRSAPPRQQTRRFAGARISRTEADWLATNQAINQELRQDLDKLRARGRDLVKNNDYAKKFSGMCADNIIGSGGVRLQMRVEDAPGKPDRMANAAIEGAWRRWCSNADITGQQDLRGLCAGLMGAMPSDGEFLVREVMGEAAGNPFNYALQVIDVDRIDTQYNGIEPRTGNTVIMGVEVNAYRRPVALHIWTAHPQDYTGRHRLRERVPIEEMIHGFKVDHAEQVRGIPWMAPGMLSLHHLGGFMFSAILAAEHGANHYGFFTSKTGEPPPGMTDDDSSGAGAGADKQPEPVMTSQPGVFDTLPEGYDFKPYESKYPETNYGPFVKTALQRVASGWRVAYNSLANDLEGVSFSSIRSGTLEERDRWMADQEWFIHIFMERVFQKWLLMALLSGQIRMPTGSALPASKIEKFRAHVWMPRRWQWVDPKSDTESSIMQVRAGLMSPQDLCASQGFDFDEVLTQLSQARKAAEDLGVPLPAYDATPGAGTGTAKAPAPS